MTNIELIRMLVKHPPEAEVLIFDAEDRALRPVTGCTAGADPERGGRYMVELGSDSPF